MRKLACLLSAIAIGIAVASSATPIWAKQPAKQCRDHPAGACAARQPVAEGRAAAVNGASPVAGAGVPALVPYRIVR